MSYQKLKGDITLARLVRFTAGADVADGAVVVDGGRVGVAHNDTKNGAEGLMVVATDEHGIVMPKATGQAWARHAKLYWDAAASKVTTTATANTLIGRAAVAAASADTTGVVELTNAL